MKNQVYFTHFWGVFFYCNLLLQRKRAIFSEAVTKIFSEKDFENRAVQSNFGFFVGSISH